MESLKDGKEHYSSHEDTFSEDDDFAYSVAIDELKKLDNEEKKNPLKRDFRVVSSRIYDYNPAWADY